MSEKSDKLRAMLEKEKERRIKLNNRIEILERRIFGTGITRIKQLYLQKDFAPPFNDSRQSLKGGAK